MKLTIKDHIALQYAQDISTSIKTKYNNNQDLTGDEIKEFCQLLQKHLIELNNN